MKSFFNTPIFYCSKELLCKDLTGQVAIITGASSGIGWITAWQLLLQGMHLYLPCRNPLKMQNLLQKHQIPQEQYTIMYMDFMDFESVVAFAKHFKNQSDRLNVLINNAGIVQHRLQYSKNGFESTWSVNFLGHVLLTELLKEILCQTPTSRVIHVSSAAHHKVKGRKGDISLTDLNFHHRNYDGWAAYAQSKLGNILHSQWLHQEFQSSINHPSASLSIACHPGWVWTGITPNRYKRYLESYLFRPFGKLLHFLSPWDGAQSTLFCALDTNILQYRSHPQGQYFVQSQGWPIACDHPAVNPLIYDQNLIESLKKKSLSDLADFLSNGD